MGLQEQFTNMSPREQRLLSILGGVFGLILFIGIPAYIFLHLHEARTHNESVREALKNMDRMSELLAKRKGERDAQIGRAHV